MNKTRPRRKYKHNFHRQHTLSFVLINCVCVLFMLACPNDDVRTKTFYGHNTHTHSLFGWFVGFCECFSCGPYLLNSAHKLNVLPHTCINGMMGRIFSKYSISKNRWTPITKAIALLLACWFNFINGETFVVCAGHVDP